MPEPTTRSFTVPRDEHFAGLRLGRHAGADVYGDSADLAVHLLALARVEAGADLNADLADGLGDCCGAADGSYRPVERCEEAVAGCV